MADRDWREKGWSQVVQLPVTTLGGPFHFSVDFQVSTNKTRAVQCDRPLAQLANQVIKSHLISSRTAAAYL